jgi:hypothetical protein
MGLHASTPDQDLRGTNWGSFREGLRDKLERGPEMNMKDETGLGLAVHWVQQAYEDNCPLRPIKKGRKSLRWTSELESLRREVTLLFNKCWQTIIHIVGNSTERLSRDIERSYERLPKRLGGLSDLPRSARLQRALSRDPKIRLGSLVAPSGGHTQSKGETLDILLATHFPNSVVMERGVVPVAACHAKHLDWQVAARIVAY